MKRLLIESVAICSALLLGAVAGGWFESKEYARGNSQPAALPAKSERVPSANRFRVRTPALARSDIDEGFATWMASASENELREAVLDRLEKNKWIPDFHTSTLLRELCRRGPHETFAFFKNHPQGGATVMRGLFEVWASVDPRAATKEVVSYAAGLDAPWYGWRSIESPCFAALAKVDLEAARELAKQLPRIDDGRAAGYDGLLAGAARARPEEVERLLSVMLDKGIRPSDGLETWASLDPDRASAWLRANVKGRSNEAHYVAMGMAYDDPKRGLEFFYEVNDLQDGPNIGGGARAMFLRWANEDFDAAYDWMSERVDQGRMAEMLVMFNYAQPPEELLERVLAGDPRLDEHVKHSVLERMANEQGAEAALARLETAPDSRKAELQEAAMSIGLLEPDEDFIASFFEVEGRGWTRGLRTALIRAPEKLNDWVELVPPEHQASFADRIARMLAENHPEAVLELMSQLDDPESFARKGAADAIGALVHTDPRRAMEAVEDFPAGDGRAVAIEMLAINHVVDDLDGTLAWLQTQRGANLSEERYTKLLDKVRRLHPWAEGRIDEVMTESSR